VLDLIYALTAGLIGTAVMTLWQELERRARGCERGTLAAEIGATLFGLRPRTDAEVRRLDDIVHWTYGVASGLVYAAVRRLGAHGPGAVLLHTGLVWGGDTALLVMLRLAPPPWRRDGTEVTSHAIHRVILALVTTATYGRLATHGAR
jgi:hypothetical protein